MSNTMKADKERDKRDKRERVRESDWERRREKDTKREEPWSHMIGRSAVSGTSTVSHTSDPLMHYDSLTASTLCHELNFRGQGRRLNVASFLYHLS